MPTISLTDEDRAILDLESETVAGHTCKALLFGPDAPDIAELRESIAARIEAAPSLTWRLGSDGGRPAWIPSPDFNVADHVVADPGPELDNDALRRRIADLFAERLDRDRPLWQIDRLPLADGGAALVWRIHHALADGTTAMHIAEAILWDQPGAVAADHPARAGSPSHAADQRRRRGHITGFMRRELRASSAPSPFDGRIGPSRAVAFTRIPLAAIHDAAKALAGASLNDAVLACVAGSLRAWIETGHGSLGEVRVRVPVSLHEQGADAANHNSHFALGLPIGEPDRVRRLELISARTTARKQHADAQRLDEILHEDSHVSPRLRNLCEDLEGNPRAFALNVSNVRGPRSPVTVLGAELAELYSLAEIGERHALRIAVISLTDSLYFGLCGDPEIVDGIDEIAAGIATEAELLVSANRD